ncbi:MAG: glycosyltransferase family 2 protein [Elusimicrobia bacterium]|nr:glycosyltransferase family 2 protein [Elusimicrobiota bacterium]
MTKKKISVVIPVFNEREILPLLFERLEGIETRHPEYRWEFIFANDGSSDGSDELLRRQGALKPNYCAIHFSKNFGHQIAVTAGMDYADGDAVALIDADLQDPPEIIVEMIKLWEKGYAIVYGKRRSRAGETFLKKKTAALFYRILSIMTDTDIPVDTGDFRLMDRKVIEVVRQMRESHRFVRGIVAWTGFSSIAYEYDRHCRPAGETKYPLKKMLKFAVDAVLSFSNLPLRIASYIGWLATLLGVLGILTVLYLRLFTVWTVPGISAVLVSVIFIGGVQLTILGIVGEYIGRMFTEMKGRPLYVVKGTDNIDLAGHSKKVEPHVFVPRERQLS